MICHLFITVNWELIDWNFTNWLIKCLDGCPNFHQALQEDSCKEDKMYLFIYARFCGEDSRELKIRRSKKYNWDNIFSINYKKLITTVHGPTKPLLWRCCRRAVVAIENLKFPNHLGETLILVTAGPIMNLHRTN